MLVDVWRVESHDRDIDRQVDPRSHDLISFLLTFGSGLRPRSLFKSGFLDNNSSSMTVAMLITVHVIGVAVSNTKSLYSTYFEGLSDI